ncbi:hypothetical protein EJ110_NYTH46776 [Nymphaea thermarum]|nr:hypothetical protein EJ110_NYTH46776 [Nymphaea thermarum]
MDICEGRRRPRSVTTETATSSDSGAGTREEQRERETAPESDDRCRYREGGRSMLPVREDGGDARTRQQRQVIGRRCDRTPGSTDPSTSMVKWAIAELIWYSHIQKKSLGRTQFRFGQDRLVKESDIPNLQVVFKEIFHLHWSMPLSLPLMASESFQRPRYNIAKGACLLVNILLLAGTRVCECVDQSAGVPAKENLHRLVHAYRCKMPASQLLKKLNMDEAYGLTLQRIVPPKVEPRPMLAPRAHLA